jgi:protein TonB
VSDSGKVLFVRIARSSGFVRLDQAATEALKKWTFSPALQSGKAVPVWINYPIKFALPE